MSDLDKIIKENMIELNLKEYDLELHDIRISDFKRWPSWETAVKLSNLLGEIPGYWMDLAGKEAKGS